MADYVLIHGDKAKFLPTFGVAMVSVQDGELKGSGPAKLGDKALCVVGDESSVSVSNCSYLTPVYSVAGMGTLEIASLAGDQQATKTQTGATKVMLVGSTFTAKFKVQSPAQHIPPSGGPPVLDATPEYSGSGNFVTTNTKFRGV
jgi:hypothetical protein